MFYGDSTTGTFAVGEVVKDTATVAGIAMSDQPFGLINDTTNPVVAFGTSGIFGLGFPWGR
jgi:Eukaryotic aspartyl protease